LFVGKNKMRYLTAFILTFALFCLIGLLGFLGVLFPNFFFYLTAFILGVFIFFCAYGIILDVID